ncbi:hypothetical protein JCM16303_000215 [Sporobolomyces ruberrimus]
MSGNKGVQYPLKPTPSSVKSKTTTPSTSALVSLNSLKSFKRNKTVKPTNKEQKNAITLGKFGSSSRYPSEWNFLQTEPTRGGPVTVEKGTVGGVNVLEDVEADAPWTAWLKEAAKAQTKQPKGKGRDKGKGKERATLTIQIDDDNEDEVLVGEQSWESPSDRSTTPSHPDEPGPSPSSYRKPSSPEPSSSRPVHPVHPSRLQNVLSAGPRLASATRFDDPLTPSFAAVPSMHSQPTVHYSSSAPIPQGVAASWHLVHLGGIHSSLSNHDILSFVIRPHLPKPVAIQFSRSREAVRHTFLAYASKTQAKNVVASLGDYVYRDEEGASRRVTVDLSSKAASEFKWFETDLIGSREQDAKLAGHKRKRGDEVGKDPGDDGERSKRKDLPPHLAQASQSGRSHRPLPRPPPPPPPLHAPSQELLDVLLAELRRSDPNQTYLPSSPFPDPTSLVTYHADLDPRKRRKLK